MKSPRRLLLILFAAGAVGIQFIPVRRINPPVESLIEWDSPRTKELFTRACLDCHSHETVWPWYGKIAPVSWYIAKRVNDGRATFNISVHDLKGRSDVAGDIEQGKMPPRSYLRLHPKARLTDAEREELAHGLQETFAYSFN